jgi:hypothetical protein
MSRPPIWFERKFEFAFPVEQHPNLCARLRGTPARLEEVVHSTARDLLERNLLEKWLAQEHAGHIDANHNPLPIRASRCVHGVNCGLKSAVSDGPPPAECHVSERVGEECVLDLDHGRVVGNPEGIFITLRPTV